MTERENIFARWSRLKRTQGGEPRSEGARADNAKQTPEAASGANSATPAFDPASLPSVDSISASTDIRDFLRPGVPAQLTSAALRRAWTADPAIRDFIGIAENQWDFTDPNSIPGFGSLGSSNDVGQLVDQAMGKLGPFTKKVASESVSSQEVMHTEDAGRGVAGMPTEEQSPGVIRNLEKNQKIQDDSAVQHDENSECEVRNPNRRAHGGALPR